MTTIKNYYLSQILNSNVMRPDGKQLGVVKDFISSNGERPKIIACQLISKKIIKRLSEESGAWRMNLPKLLS